MQRPRNGEDKNGKGRRGGSKREVERGKRVEGMENEIGNREGGRR